MNKLLVINAHPEVVSKISMSLQVFDHFLRTYKEHINDEEVIEQINLYEDVVPMIDKVVLSGWEKSRNGEPLTHEENEVLERMNKILAQFKSANKYLIVMPLHNFNIPSKLKDYMDNILIARETFKYTENGSVGLLNDGRSMVVIQASGSLYTNGDWYTEVEYSHKYLKSMFNFIGIEDFKILRVQGTALLNTEDVLKNALNTSDQLSIELAKK
ncbi:FMN-dependent NADH-azoreductase [Bacillus ndiopicus]|uniref:FMN-dependent NADH-azoreductase n=1 Tax=Bacillus ndiopicus TaxID=1347368 RepID=UPI0005A67F57|nr:NAD(P)H-dependent oxidoreductase [Bacillus ndiopicus]